MNEPEELFCESCGGILAADGCVTCGPPMKTRILLPARFQVGFTLTQLIQLRDLLVKVTEDENYYIGKATDAKEAGEKVESYHQAAIDRVRETLKLYEVIVGEPYRHEALDKYDAAVAGSKPKADDE